MRKIIIKIKIENDDVAFNIEKNYRENSISTLELCGILDLIKDSQLKKVGEVIKKETEEDA